jgi:hypothetical protein
VHYVVPSCGVRGVIGVGVLVVVADFWFLLWNNVVVIIGCTALSLPSPPRSKGGGMLLAWGSCYVGEAAECC